MSYFAPFQLLIQLKQITIIVTMANTKIDDFFLELIKSNKNQINRICAVYAKNREDQKDLVQDVLLNIWKALPNFKNLANINTWLYRITLNVCLRSKYESSQKNKIQLNSIKLKPFVAEPKNVAYEQLYYCIGQLPETDKSIIILFLEDLPYQQIAEIIGISENHVAVKIKRIKNKLLKCLSTNQQNAQI